MADWFHRTDKQFLASTSSSDLPEAVANYVENPSFPAGVPGTLAYKYLNVSGETITEMTQPEKDAVDAAEAAARLAAIQTEAVADVDGTDQTISMEIRALIQIFNKRDNYLVNRIAELQSDLQAIKASTGGTANIRAAISASYLATNTRPLPDARQDYKDEINAGTVNT